MNGDTTFLTVISVVVALFIGLIVLAAANDSAEQGRLSRAEKKAEAVCNGRLLALYEVEDEERVVFTCADGRFRTLSYSG